MTSRLIVHVAALAFVTIPTIAPASPPKRSSGAMVETSGTSAHMASTQAKESNKESGDKDRFRDKDRDDDRDKGRHCDSDDHKCHKKPPSPR